MAETNTLTVDERRAKKAEKRIKQREITVLRAGKMHKARLLAAENGSFQQASTPPALNIGCSGWFYWHLRGSFYPTQMPTKDWFSHYADHFSTVELNAPFYSWPTVATVQSWRKQAEGHDMVYTVKASELITHIKKFEGTKTLIRDFGHIADLLGPLMGCFLFQLPPGYYYSPARLRDILEQLDPDRRNVVEFRHASWWMTRSTQRSRSPVLSFVPAAARACPTTWSRRPMISISVSTASTGGTAMITAMRN